MPVQFETFSQDKIDRLKNSLEAAFAKGRPKSYEIWVDGLQIVPRTEDPADFDRYEDALNAESQQVKVVVYCTEKTNRNDKYFYALKATSPEQAIEMGMAGLPVKSFNNRDIDSWRQKQVLKTEQNREIGELRSEIKYLNELLDEKQEYIEEIEKALQEAQANKNTLKGIDLGAVVGKGLEHLIRNTTSMWGKVPALAGLAEEVELDTRTRNANVPQNSEPTEVSFTKKTQATDAVVLTEQEKQLLAFFKEMQRLFSQMEFEQVIAIVDYLSKDKAELITVLEHLKNEDPS